MKKLIIAMLLVPSLCFGAAYQAEVIVGWTGKGTSEDPYRPNLAGYEIKYYEDKTNQPGGSDQIKEPNQFVAYIEADNATILKMKDDGIVVLWMKPKSDTKQLPKQTKAELDVLKTALTAKGVPSADISKTALADTSKADVTAVDVATQLKAVMKEFPAAKVEEVKK
jgi:hypothetical protein